MKLKYSLLTIAAIGVILLAFIISDFPGKTTTNNELTPEEMWNMQFQKKKEQRKNGYNKADHPDMFTKYFKDITTRIGSDKSGYKMNYQKVEFDKAINNLKKLNLPKVDLPWVQRGPGNVGGRTRAIVLDPDDATNQTWFAGAASGGIWKTVNAGTSWTNLSDYFTNLSINALAIAVSNTDVIYAGTGESFPGGTYLMGNGIWKSTDKGVTWTQLAVTATDQDFAYTNRIIVDPTNADIVLAATETGIFKSINGGTSWTKVHSSSFGVEDLIPDPTNFNVLFAGENSRGVLRSTDAGDSWALSSNGLGNGARFEVTVSKVDHNYVYTSVDVSTTEANVYFSQDNGINWKKFNDAQNFLGGQGPYDNTLVAHPYVADEVFVGGVDIWKLKFNGTETTSAPAVLRAYAENTTFMSFINFGGGYLGGGLSIEEGTNLVPSDWTSIEVRFGPGITQKAHRFTVPPGSTSAVPPLSYTYVDYIDVPFQVWDKTNNIQLMVSFRDQENDGAFNLYVRTGDLYGQLGREYIFINSVAYNPTTPSANIAQAGGHLYKALYMIWPTLTEGETWTPDNLPVSKIVVDYGTITLITGVKTSIADSYGNFGGPNGYSQSQGFGTTAIPGLHPDHHNLIIVPTGNPNFTMIDGNDGGFGISYNNAVTFNQLPNNYITTQFYGVAKHPTLNEYFGGMQDNGSWQSPANENASSSSNYFFRIGGDGFECLWHPENPNLMLGSVYYNSIRKSTNKGLSWTYSTGITTNDGPFITKLSASKENPDLVFAVNNTGVYRSTNFGSSFTKRTISTNWAISAAVSSSHEVEVSQANGKIVWAGGGMATSYGLQIQVSTDYGMTFTALDDYDVVGLNAYISGIATHPSQENTAYVLFSLSDAPKVLRTTDLGETWEDISGFGTGDESTNGFPDVVTHCLLVMPYDPNIIWVGTDIGLFESTDNGVSWHYANNGLPPVSVYEMKIVGNQVVVATHGRGIWSVDIPEIDNAPYITGFEVSGQDEFQIISDLKVAYDSVEVYINNTLDSTIILPATGPQDLRIAKEITSGNYYFAYIIGYVSETGIQSNTLELLATSMFDLSSFLKGGIKIYPNPASDRIGFDLDSYINDYTLYIYNINGQLIMNEKRRNSIHNELDIEQLNTGTYMIRLVTSDKTYSQLFQKTK